MDVFKEKRRTGCYKISKIFQDLPMPGLRDMPSSNAMTPEPHLNTLENSWEEHEHLMNPMFLQSPDEIDLPPLDPELLDHQRRKQVGNFKAVQYYKVIKRKQNLPF